MQEYRNIEEKIINEKLNGALQENVFYSSILQNFKKNNFSTEDIAKIDVDAYINELGNRLETLERNREIAYYRIQISDRKLVGKLVIFAKRVIRKLLKWLLEPICIQQTVFNNAVAPAFGRLIELQINSDNKMGIILDNINKIENKNIDFEYKIANLELLEIKLEELQEQNKILRNNIMNHESLFEELQEKNKILQDKISNPESSNEDNFWKKNSVAQSGEDMITAYIMREFNLLPHQCNYLDLGANHAKDMSNTYYYYNRGANGVLVEANPNLIDELKFHRSRDIVLNRCVSAISGEKIEFYILNGDGLSTPDYEGAMKAININPNLRIVDTVLVDTISVNDILGYYFSESPPVILNIDIEGKELEILYSIDFKKYRPLIIIVEMIPYKPCLIVDEKNNKITEYMREQNYVEYAFTGINSIFIDSKKLREVTDEYCV